MRTESIEIINKLGLHARAAAKLVAAASAFASEIQVGKADQPEKKADCKSIMAVMLLAAAKGTHLEFELNGQDEDEAWDAISRLINDRFEEDE